MHVYAVYDRYTRDYLGLIQAHSKRQARIAAAGRWGGHPVVYNVEE